MSLFSGLGDEIKALNSDVKNVANCERAKKLRRKLLSIGLPMAIIGFAGVFTCFVLFATAGFSGFNENGFTAKIKSIGYMICVKIIDPTDKNNYTPENINRRVKYVILHE